LLPCEPFASLPSSLPSSPCASSLSLLPSCHLHRLGCSEFMQSCEIAQVPRVDSYCVMRTHLNIILRGANRATRLRVTSAVTRITRNGEGATTAVGLETNWRGGWNWQDDPQGGGPAEGAELPGDDAMEDCGRHAMD
jgi:hypothetical protein